jgi:hypothetical protein
MGTEKATRQGDQVTWWVTLTGVLGRGGFESGSARRTYSL